MSDDISNSGNGSSIVGCYSLHLYCVLKNPEHEFNEFPHEYTAEAGSKCRAEARKDGWSIRSGSAVCPRCRGNPTKEKS